MQNKLLFVILARKNSKRIKNKNMRLFLSKPLISWTLEQALRIKKDNTRVLLSTDSIKMIEYSKKFKDLEIIKRPKRLSLGSSPSIDAIKHAINKIDYSGNIILLQPTSPLRSDHDVKKAIDLIKGGKTPLMSVCKCVHDSSLLTLSSPLRKRFLSIKKKKQSVYFPNGAIYGAHSSWLKNNNSFYTNKTHMFLMPEERSIDIDFEYQFIMSEALYERNK